MRYTLLTILCSIHIIAFSNKLDSVTCHPVVKQGIELRIEGKMNEAYAKFKEVYTSSDHPECKAYALNNMGILFYHLNDLDSALFFYLKAEELVESNNILKLQSSLYTNIGIIYSRHEKFDSAQVMFKKSIALHTLRNDKHAMAAAYSNLAKSCYKSGDYICSRANWHLVIGTLDTLKDSALMARSFSGLGHILIKEEQYQEALDHYDRAIEFARWKKVAMTTRCRILIGMGRASVSLNDFASAQMYLDSAMALSYQQTDTEITVTVLKELVLLAKAKSDFTTANSLLDTICSIKDRLLAEREKEGIRHARAKFDFYIKEQQLANELVAQKQDRQFFLTLAAFVLWILISSVVILYYRIKLMRNNREKLISEKQLADLQLAQTRDENEKLSGQISMINQELVSVSFLLENKNAVLRSVESLINDANSEELNSKDSYLKTLQSQLIRDKSMERSWENFQLYFERIHNNFFMRLKSDYPKLTSSDLKLAAFILLGLTNKEIGQIFNITSESVRKRRQRFREKLNLSKDQESLEFLNTYLTTTK